ncbi:copia protein [Tanacetum coccineum]
MPACGIRMGNVASPPPEKSGSTNLGEKKDLIDCQLSTPNSHHETEEVSSDEDVDEWLNAEMGKRMIGQDKDEEEDALIDILKTVVEECKSIYKKAQIPSSRTSEIQGASFVAEEEGERAGINMMPKSLFEHLKLTNLKKTSLVVEMVDMTKKAPLGIVENILVKIDTLEGPNKTMLLGRPFLAMLHAQINVFRGEISLGIGNEKVKFDTNGEICHFRIPHEIIYMASSIQKGEYINPHEVENNDSPALEQRTLYYREESIDTVDSSDDSQEDEVGSHLSKDVVSR